MDKLLIVTPCVPNGLPTQGVVIAEQLSRDGVRVQLVSRARTRIGRVIDICFRSPWLAARHPAVLVDVFGERAFVYESVAILTAALLRRRVVAMLHNSMFPGFVARWPRWSRFVLGRASVVLTPHNFLREQLSATGIRVDGVIPNFIQLENYKYRERVAIAPRFLYLRGMHPLYNPEMAIRAFALIQTQFPEAELTLAGRDAPNAARCRALVEELGLRRVTFAGLVPKADISALADRHDIHLHTNRIDNMPVTIIEMWASGLPIVATNVGGIPDLVRDGEDAILVPSEDHRAMAAACLDMLKHPAGASRLAANGRARAEALSWPRVRPMWERVLFGRSEGSYPTPSELGVQPQGTAKP